MVGDEVEAMKNITYAYDESGVVYSFYNGECALPVLDFEGMTPENNFQARYMLQRFSIYDVRDTKLTRTKTIPIALKNRHRAFWGLKPIKEQ